MNSTASGFVVAALVSCATPPQPASPRAAAPPTAASFSAPGLADRDWGVLGSQRFLLAVPVPEASAWQTDDRSGRWFIAAHRGSQSVLALRSWREGSVVDHRACESAARLWRPDLFGRSEADLVDRRSVPAPVGFDTEVGFTVRREGGALQAIAAATGGNVRRCIAVVFVSRVDGADSERVAADRLLFATTRIFSRLESRTIEDRVVPAVAAPR